MTTPRHEFYETDERLTLSIFDKGADPAQVQITFEPRKFSYTNGDKILVLEPLKGQIDASKCDFTVGKVKVEIRLVKMAQGRWGGLVGEAPDPLSSFPTSAAPTATARKQQKNWEGITTDILKQDKPITSDQDPNAGGDAAVNDFFKKLYADADDDTRRAMLKSYQESGGTTLSTNWTEVGKGNVEVKPPEGSEWKKWAA
ncbi:SGS-domain-containing protein [Epithele typhae]|uniref:SGS-domain-containing protein n=1 Tax=Epithele typhae TaxID=378194 RepID=UPI002007C1E4|nr:SGS-domain-containing protein [Epithele typhae]KAH9944342.1 SGS-domain-containing protein [Epithele typhae]